MGAHTYRWDLEHRDVCSYYHDLTLSVEIVCGMVLTGPNNDGKQAVDREVAKYLVIDASTLSCTLLLHLHSHSLCTASLPFRYAIKTQHRTTHSPDLPVL